MKLASDSVDIEGFYTDFHEVLRTSDGIAYRHYKERHSYAELFEGMQRINSVLVTRRNQQIVTYVDKTFSAYCAIYGVVLSGNTWIPLNTDMPDARLKEILAQTDPSLVLFNTSISDGVRAYLSEENIECLDIRSAIRELDRVDFPGFDFDKNEIAYIMFTSGSTGTPKGVPMTHENYLNFIGNCQQILEFEKHDVFADYHEFAFDISIFYLFCCPMVEGAIAPVRNEQDRLLPLSFIQENGVTVWASVPSAIALLQTFRPDEVVDSDVRIMFLCGEPFSLGILKYCIANMKVAHVYNFYGLTETGVENFWHKCRANDVETYEKYGFVPIGLPLDGNRVRVSEDKALHLSGCQITPGYLGGIGEERFETLDGVRWFNTGDIVEEHEGVYFCKGRVDSQVKVKGYRIELMDIEVHLRRYEGVEDAVCFVKERGSKNVLVGVIKPRRGFLVDLQGLRRFLAEHLPAYMGLSRVNVLEDFPVNRNGKIDRARIKEMFTT
jgi:D-alanine--poly(phosphoribitol) ligase subunit 1